MALAYFDSSALIKLIVQEDGSELAAEVWDGCDAAVSSRLAYPEVRAALSAAGRAGRLKPEAQRRAEAAWEEYWALTRTVELTAPVAAHAGALAGEHALRGADAVHLASVLALRSADAIFAVWDGQLRDGAHAAGVRLVPSASSTG